MTRVRTRRRRFGSEAGYTMVEMLIATLIMVVVTGAMFDLLNPASGMFNSQPEVSDMQQRMRVGIDSMQKDLVMAGAGTYVGASAGALYNFFAPVLPRRSGDIDPDPPGTFRKDAISITYVPSTPSQTTIRDDMPQSSAQLKVNAQTNCPPNKHDALCGFKEGMRVM
ncbi:MAG: PilW family protein, partial [Vicinamibacterales bacterium]